jgi:hypothetical protein
MVEENRVLQVVLV